MPDAVIGLMVNTFALSFTELFLHTFPLCKTFLKMCESILIFQHLYILFIYVLIIYYINIYIAYN